MNFRELKSLLQSFYCLWNWHSHLYFKDTAMQTEKTLISDRLPVSKVSWKILHFNYLQLCINLPLKIYIFLRSSLFFNCFCCLFCFELRLYGSITYKLEQLWMQKFQRLLFLLKRSYICYYIICMTVPLTLSRRRPLSYRNQSIDLLWKSMDWFLYDTGLRLESVNQFAFICITYLNDLNREWKSFRIDFHEF